ncbi:hypothetical protein PoB_007557900 [Plakobranchus ocellatus]|uniref:Uncharacterized protein n=1 Tax=Plakobranchus ocellatus TaxID=259542 RepID=A0AAV4DXZ4_9GAST|nr:hypothetical protein PoB_007557900 [Plakobranchus ocellatus]
MARASKLFEMAQAARSGHQASAGTAPRWQYEHRTMRKVSGIHWLGKSWFCLDKTSGRLDGEEGASYGRCWFQKFWHHCGTGLTERKEPRVWD